MKENTVLNAATNLILINSSCKLYSKGCHQDGTFKNQHEGLYNIRLSSREIKIALLLNVVHATLLLLLVLEIIHINFELEH